MPVANSDIISYGCANANPETDAATPVGGAINKAIKILYADMSDVGGADTLEVLSSNAADTTQTLTVTGRNGAGVVVTDTFTLDGTNVVTGASSTSFSRILKAVLSAGTAGTVTVREASGNVTVFTMEGTGTAPGGTAVTSVRRMFYASEANASGGAAKTLYEKCFIANTHATLAVLSAAVSLTADGTASDLVDFDLEDAVNDTGTITDRTTAPGGAQTVRDTWSDASVSVPGGTLGDRTTGTADHIGVWVRLSLPAGESPESAAFTLTLAGSSA
jgi:hypothetical protein